MTGTNLFTQIPEELPEELETLLASGQSFRLQRIVSRGHCSPAGFWYDQEDAEWVILLSGAAELEFEGPNGTLPLHPGDYHLIPPRCRHRVKWTSPNATTVWLALYFQPDQGNS